MNTKELFKFNRSSKRLNETIDRVFGKKMDFTSFDTLQLEDARNKLRTQIHSARTASGFNETIENETLSQAQWMHDAIVAELTARQEHIVDTTTEENDSVEEKAPPGAKFKRMAKHIKAGYKDSGLDKEEIAQRAFGATWKAYKKDESIESGEDMTKLQEGEVQQASAIVTAKTMVDRVSRWIEELSGMENDTLLQLGDSIRDEMGSEQAKGFISAVAPAIQQALENLKTTRETLSTGVRQLTGEEQGAEMLGGEPGEEEMGMAEPDMMNTGDEAPSGADEFAAAEPAAGGLGDAGREQRESIDRSNNLLRALAG
jgi:hypothetical protein